MILGYGEIDKKASTKLSSWIRTSSASFECIIIPLVKCKVQIITNIGIMELAESIRNKV